MKGVLVGALIGVLPMLPAAASADHDRPVVTITDGRIAESSGLAVSPTNPRLLYTLNDSGNAPAVYAIDRRSGDVVGVTALSGYTISDTEAIGVGDDGTMWVADTGDNSGNRDDVALYAFPEPGRGDSTVTPDRYPLRYPSGSQDAETVLVGPGSHRVYVVSKGVLGGRVYRLPARPRIDRPNLLRPVHRAEVPGLVTDGSFTPDGSEVVLRTYENAVGYDARTWQETWSKSLPHQRQGESLTVDADGESFLIGSEGTPSQVLRVALPKQVEERSTRDERNRADDEAAADESRLDVWLELLAGLVVLLVVLVGWVTVAARRSRRRHQQGNT